MSELRVVHATGDAAARGQQIGRELRDLINESIDFYHRYLDRRGVSSQQLQELLTPFLVASESQFPSHMALLKGMSVGAMVPVLELFAVNAFEELEPMLEAPEGGLLFLQRKEGDLEAPPSAGEPRPRTDRCSSFSVVRPETTFLAHNEHWLAGDRGNVAPVIDPPGDRPASVASPTVVCCLPAVGVNSHGGGQGVGSLTASDDRVGVPRVLVSRHALEAMDREDALARAGHPARSGGYGHVYAFANGDAFIVETTGRELALLDRAGARADHHLHARAAPRGSIACASSSPSAG